MTYDFFVNPRETPATRALQVAASVAGLLIIPEAMIAEAPKNKAGHSHGGGGMGGMDF